MEVVRETELIARCRRNDALAWETLFDEHYDSLGRFVFQLSPRFTREDVEEICQEVFIAVVRNLSGFQGACRFRTWLFRIATNKARDFIEHQVAAKRGGGQVPASLDAVDPASGLSLELPSPAPGPDANLLGVERLQLIRQALNQLGEPCREIVELRYFGGLSYEDLAEALELNPKTVSSRLSKCLDRLEVIAREVFAGKPVPFPV